MSQWGVMRKDQDIKFRWINAVKGEYGPASSTTRLVLIMLSTHMNIDGSSCFPSTALLASETKLTERSVCTHLEKAEKEGWIKRHIKGGGQNWKRYQYTPSIPDKALNDVQHVNNKGTEPASAPYEQKGTEPHAEGTEPHDIKALNDVQSSISYSSSRSSSLLNNVEDTIQDEKIIKEEIPQSTDSYLLAEHLLNSILKRRPSFKKPRLNSWAKQIDSMLGQDKRTSQEIRAVIDWCQKNTFWQNNILSTKTLREKFDKLALQMASKSTQINNKQGRQPEPFLTEGYYDN